MEVRIFLETYTVRPSFLFIFLVIKTTSSISKDFCFFSVFLPGFCFSCSIFIRNELFIIYQNDFRILYFKTAIPLIQSSQ